MLTTSVWCLTDQMWVSLEWVSWQDINFTGQMHFSHHNIYYWGFCRHRLPQIYLSACQFMGKNSHAAFQIQLTPHVSYLMSSTPTPTRCDCASPKLHIFKYRLSGVSFGEYKQSYKKLPFLSLSKHLKGHSGPRVSEVFWPNICEVIRDPASDRFLDRTVKNAFLRGGSFLHDKC